LFVCASYDRRIKILLQLSKGLPLKANDLTEYSTKREENYIDAADDEMPPLIIRKQTRYLDNRRRHYTVQYIVLHMS